MGSALMKRKKILIPLPGYGFDPTESAIPWKVLSDSGFEIVFTTPLGKKPAADVRMQTGNGLGPAKRFLMARRDAVAAYEEMAKSPSFNNPIKYTEIREPDFDGILLPGGHDKGVREYLESEILQRVVVDFFSAQKPVGAICHGVLLAARSVDPATKQSVIYRRKTTALLKSLEWSGYVLTRWWLKDYYLTYPGTTVEAEVRKALSDPGNFVKGPPAVFRDDLDHPERGFSIRDGNYLSARWPGDAHNFALEFVRMLREG